MLKQNVFLVKQLVLKDLRSRYAGSTFGILWAFATPLLQLLLFTFVFSTVLRIPLTGERGVDSFPLFLFAGLLPWIAIQESLMRSTTGVQDNAPIIQKASIPPVILVVTVIFSAILHEIFALIAFLAILTILGKATLAWCLLPLVLAVQIVMTFGGGLILFCVQVFFRDTVQIVNYVLMAWFYFTPIVYPLSLVQKGVDGHSIPPGVLTALRMNPMTGIVEAYRDVILRGEISGIGTLSILTLGGIALSWVAFHLYGRLRPHFADSI